MTRFLVLFAAAFAFAFTACERHPIAGETLVTHTHGGGGTKGLEEHEGGEGHGAAEGKHEEKHEEKKGAEAKPAEHAAGKAEEAPKFFPEKK